MKRISYLLAVFRVAARRLWHQRGMALSLLLGLTMAVAVSVSIPIYADAVSYRVLNERLPRIAAALGPEVQLTR